MSEWRWSGIPQHFIAASKCCWHLATFIDDVLVSSVGCYHPAGVEPSDETRHPLGLRRLYETMVFRTVDGKVEDWSELDSDGYTTEAEADAGHLALCEKWSKTGATKGQDS